MDYAHFLSLCCASNAHHFLAKCFYYAHYYVTLAKWAMAVHKETTISCHDSYVVWPQLTQLVKTADLIFFGQKYLLCS